MSEKLIVYTREDDEKELTPTYELDVLPMMREADLVGLIQGLAKTGDMVKYEDGFYLVENGWIKPCSRPQAVEQGREVSDE